MSLNAGDRITYYFIPGMQRFNATILSIDTTTITLRLDTDEPSTIPEGQYVMISDSKDDVDYYSEVIGKEGPTLRLKRMWTGKRGFFRVDDVFPVLFRKVNDDASRVEARVYTTYNSQEVVGLETPEDTVNPRLWNLLVDINTKLGMILEHLHLESEGLAKADSLAVNISASGIRFASSIPFEHGDLIEVKMLLPANPAVGVLAHGKVVRVAQMDDGAYETSLNFVGMGDEVRDIIIQYTLKRQREVVRRYRDQQA